MKPWFVFFTTILFLLMAFEKPSPLMGQQTATDKAGRSENEEKERKQAIKECLAILRDKRWASDKEGILSNTILELGHLQAVEAIPDIVEHLEVGGPDPKGRRTGVWDSSYDYPAVKALRLIGKPALPGIIKALGEKDRSAKYLHNAHYTMIGILPGKRKEVTATMEKAIAEEKDAAKVKRLKAVLEAMRADDLKPVPKEKESK